MHDRPLGRGRLPAPLGLGGRQVDDRASAEVGMEPAVHEEDPAPDDLARSADALDRAAPESEVDRWLALAHGAGVAADEVRPAGRRRRSRTPRRSRRRTGRPSARRGGSWPGPARAPSRRGWSRRASTADPSSTSLKWATGRPAIQLARQSSAWRTGGRSASLSRPSARSDAGARSLRPCWYWMPMASQPNRSAIRTAAMYSRSWSRTWSSVSSVAPSLPEAEASSRGRAASRTPARASRVRRPAASRRPGRTGSGAPCGCPSG